MIPADNHPIHDRRVRLANIRTFLAFCRTAIACWGLATAFFHLLDDPIYKHLWKLFCVLGGILFLWGVAEFVLVEKLYIRRESKKPESEGQQHK